MLPQDSWNGLGRDGAKHTEALGEEQLFVSKREQYLLSTCRVNWTGHMFITVVWIHSWDSSQRPSAHTSSSEQ